ncbi:myb-like protein AA [Dendronephthya gigantea]|uniref:myb-like protein AA n=1 Tax=Dendronephthya gigantea TaxID=151771 RepID=UPI00106BEDCB|nr:myb-like protein AA [Dendronephthya gigantea]XP_028415333.1 myb-like protein AA [Dendronephthya gigantea]
MKRITVLIVLLVVKHVQSYVPNSDKTSRSEVGRRRMLVNLLHAIRTLRDHKKVKSASLIFPKIDNIHSDEVGENYISPESKLVSQIEKKIEKVRTTGKKNQISKRSKGIHSRSKGTHHRKHRNGKELFLQLLQTLRSLRTKKSRSRVNLPKERNQQVKKEMQVTKGDVKTTMQQRHNNRWLDFDERSNVLKPVKHVAKIGTSQTNKARYSFAQARMSFLEALETAQDEKLSKLANLEKRFSYILPEKEENNHLKVGKVTGHTFQNAREGQSTTRFSHVRRPYHDLVFKRPQNVIPTKLSILEKPFKRQKASTGSNSIFSSHSTTQNSFEKKENVAPFANDDTNDRNISKVMENPPNESKRRKELFLDELLSISNAHSKFEKLKRLEKLKEKLLRNFDNDKAIEKEGNVSSHSYKNERNRPIIRKGGNPTLDMKNYTKSSRIVSGKPNDDNQHNTIAGIGLPGKVGSSKQGQIDNENNGNQGNATVLEEHLTTNSSQTVAKSEPNSQDVNIIGAAPQASGYVSTKSKNGSESDHSYLPLDSSAIAQRNEGEELNNSLSSVVTEHDKIISELTKSKELSNQMSNDKNRTENSHKTLSNILQKAQSIFLKKVKEILAGSKINGRNTKLASNENSEKAPEKPKGGVINTSAYVMDESPHDEKTAAQTTPNNSGIVPKTPTNDELLNSVNRNIAQPATQPPNSGINSPMQSLQTSMDHTPPLQTESVGQQGPGNPVSGQPLTYSQLQDAHEEERIAMQQENVFRSMQPGAGLPSSNGVNSAINSATMPSQRYMGPNPLPQTNHNPLQNPGFPPNVDDLSEYRGGMERYQLSNRLGYHADIDDRNEDDYLPRRHRLHFYRHRTDDEDDYDDDDDEDDDDEDFDEDGDKKSKIGKPHHVTGKKKHSTNHGFGNPSNSTKVEHKKHKKGHVKSTGR